MKHMGRDVLNHPQAMKIELLGSPDCPNTAIIREHLRTALKSIGADLTFQDINQDALPQSDLRRGWPTPTVLVNGRDLFDMAPPNSPAMACRIYPAGVPSAERIAARLRYDSTKRP
ncbi:MAG: hypothetical protein KJ057_17355 [Phycisphaerae bacterium]|nr:MAG: hypothetical protein EDS66_16490 [Planctomycetota bacterium]KAB2939917.1 MAG: hypothetical protein F9K17_14540 [Phycisphaerae bacterium]MBE7455123.1 hypothetical protein [Planctomycetia bacterium]MCK6466436.1 hypothetical protein [Phycisphaerae bacterium]MCL4720233.1 hypothetical protein [Phycisphaerae bacterium]